MEVNLYQSVPIELVWLPEDYPGQASNDFMNDREQPQGQKRREKFTDTLLT